MIYKKHIALMRLLGLRGVDSCENAKARLWGKRFEIPMVIAALWILVDWYLRHKGVTDLFISFFSDWFIWSIFLAELLVMLSIVDNRKRYLKQNWMSVLIVLAGLPILWGSDTFYTGILRTMRLALTISILLRISKDTRELLSRHNLGTTLLICFVILVISGLLISGIDPAFSTPADGLWWALVTITTVGYGDLVPQTFEGRIFGSILILMGVGIFSILTASFSAFFIAQDERSNNEKEEKIAQQVTRIEGKLTKMEEKLDNTLALLNSIQSSQQETANSQKDNSSNS